MERLPKVGRDKTKTEKKRWRVEERKNERKRKNVRKNDRKIKEKKKVTDKKKKRIDIKWNNSVGCEKERGEIIN